MAASDHESIHVLLLSYPAQGHINPLLQLGKRLAAHRGVRCTLAVTRSVLAGSSEPPATGGEVHLAAYSDGCDRRGYDEVGDERAFLARLEAAGSSTLAELLRSESGHGRPVRVVVYDAFLPWAPPVARRHGAACAAFFTQACAVNVAYAHAWAGLVELPLSSSSPAPAPPLPGLPMSVLEPADFPSFLTDPAGRSGSAYLDLLLRQCQGLEVADHVLVNSFHELQPQEADYMASRWGARTIGPTVPSVYLEGRLPDDVSYGFHLHDPMAAECKAWLDAQPPRSVVYASFGSLATPGPEQMAEVAEGLHGSGKYFLWVVRASETPKIPAGFAGRTKEKGLVVPWCPQLEVLAHAAVGCFITHCGWNSTTEALAAGVPMVAVPQWSDQPTNAKYVEDVWRVGVRVRPDGGGVVRREEVERRVREVMEGQSSEEYRKNATGWKEKAKMAMSEGGSSDSNIVEFLTKIRQIS